MMTTMGNSITKVMIARRNHHIPAKMPTKKSVMGEDEIRALRACGLSSGSNELWCQLHTPGFTYFKVEPDKRLPLTVEPDKRLSLADMSGGFRRVNKVR